MTSNSPPFVRKDAVPESEDGDDEPLLALDIEESDAVTGRAVSCRRYTFLSEWSTPSAGGETRIPSSVFVFSDHLLTRNTADGKRITSGTPYEESSVY